MSAGLKCRGLEATGVLNHYSTVLCLHVHVADLSEHISGMFAPEVTSGKIQCHLDTANVLYTVGVCVCVWEREWVKGAANTLWPFETDLHLIDLNVNWFIQHMQARTNKGPFIAIFSITSAYLPQPPLFIHLTLTLP